MLTKKKFWVMTLIPLGLGLVVALFTHPSYDPSWQLPSWAPPKWLFPIAWTILYLLMGISSYLVSESECPNRNKALFWYWLQLALNLIWPFIFFRGKFLLLSVIWIFLLLAAVIRMIMIFITVDIRAAYLSLPYFFWLLFATALTWSIYFLNA